MDKLILRKLASRTLHVSYIEEAEDEDYCLSLFERLYQPLLLWWSNPVQELIDDLMKQDIIRTLDTLPDAFRTVITLADSESLSYQEIADILQTPISTVHSCPARAHSMLQTFMAARPG